MPSRIRPEGLLAQADRAALRTELLERAHGWAPHRKPEPRPVVTIAREHGALGSLADRVAAELGFRLWNRELLAVIAKETGAAGEWVEAHDERPYSRLDETLTDWMLGSDRSQTHYRSVLRDVVRRIVKEGSAVIVGRGANFLLDPEEGLRVRAVAPLDARVAAIAAEKGIAMREARREVHQVDRDGEAFIRRSFRRDTRDPTAYDLVINTGTMPVEVAAQVVADCYRDRFGTRERARVDQLQPAHA